MGHPDCIFCKIISGNTPAHFVAKNDGALAILDAFPLVPGHTLVMPISHVTKIQDSTLEQTASVFALVREVAFAIERGLKVEATLIAIHNGRTAGQEIPHMHVHIVPRRANDGGGPVHSIFRVRRRIEDLEMESVLNKISSCINKGS